MLVFPACDTTNCNRCTDSDICESCDDELYLKIDNEQHLCVSDCGDGYYQYIEPETSIKKCQGKMSIYNNVQPNKLIYKKFKI